MGRKEDIISAVFSMLIGVMLIVLKGQVVSIAITVFAVIVLISAVIDLFHKLTNSAIVKGDEYMPVCEGYSCAFKVLCDALGVPALCVSGSMTSVSAHMWNYVQMENGLWYQVDVTTGDAYSTDLFCMMKAADAAKYEYAPNPYMGSGVNPDNGYTEGAAFTVPALAQ